MLHTPTVIFKSTRSPAGPVPLFSIKGASSREKLWRYMIHLTFEHQEHDFVEIHSPTTAVRHEQTTINDF